MSGAPESEPGEGGAPARGLVTRDAVLSVLSRDIDGAEVVMVRLHEAGVDPREISIVARGPQVEKRLIRDPEMNANQLASGDDEPVPPLLSRRFQEGRKRLLEGCWALGPLFQPRSTRTLGAQGVESLAKSLLNAGLGIKDVASLESAVKSQGHLWLGLRGAQEEMAKIAARLDGIPGVVARVLPAVGPGSGA
jgi:hypothetical protein